LFAQGDRDAHTSICRSSDFRLIQTASRRHCERREAIQLSAARRWIASLAIEAEVGTDHAEPASAALSNARVVHMQIFPRAPASPQTMPISVDQEQASPQTLRHHTGGKHMTKNVGALDRALRVAIGLVLIAYALKLGLPDTGWNWTGWIGVVPLLTATVGFCPLYRLLGLNSRSRP
jgi:hypothetical protein